MSTPTTPEPIPQETHHSDWLECPYCELNQKNPEELGNGLEGQGETECQYCGHRFQWVRTVHIYYTGKPISTP